MPPCWGLVCLTSLSQCLSRSSALGLPLGLGLGCVFVSLRASCMSVFLSLSPSQDVLSLSPRSFLGSVILSPSLPVWLGVGLMVRPSLLS